MGLFGKIFSLIIAQIIVIVVCVYIHIDDLMPKKESPTPIETTTEVIQEEPVKVVEPQDITPIQTHAKPIQKVVETTAEEEQKIVEEVKKEPLKTVQSSVKEVTKQEAKTNKPAITDAKVKALFDKKMEKKLEVQKQTVASTTSSVEKSETIDYDKIQNEIAQLVKANRIIFKRLSTEVAEESKETVEKIATILKEYPTLSVEIGGHTDAKGDKEVNEYISKHRALSVKKLLVSYGIDEKRLTAIGYGESQPIVENDPQGYSILNRRVEFKVIKD